MTLEYVGVVEAQRWRGSTSKGAATEDVASGSMAVGSPHNFLEEVRDEER